MDGGQGPVRERPTRELRHQLSQMGPHQMPTIGDLYALMAGLVVGLAAVLLLRAG